MSVRKPKMDKYLGGNFFFQVVTRCLRAEAGNSLSILQDISFSQHFEVVKEF